MRWTGGMCSMNLHRYYPVSRQWGVVICHAPVCPDPQGNTSLVDNVGKFNWKLVTLLIIHQFLPEANFGLRVLSLPACVCVCVRVSVNHSFVHAITHQPFKLGSLNLDQRCKRPWLRALLFCGMIDCDLQSQIELQSQNLPQIWNKNAS